jgi:hypothetical protein
VRKWHKELEQSLKYGLYPKASGLSHKRNMLLPLLLPVEKQHERVMAA